MPDSDGRFKGISVPCLPWQEEHVDCGTEACCGECGPQLEPQLTLFAGHLVSRPHVPKGKPTEFYRHRP